MKHHALGLRRIAAIHQYVHDLDASGLYLSDRLGLQLVGAADAESEEDTGQRTMVFRCRDCTIACSTPLRADSDAGRYLSLHPPGIGAVSLEVADIESAFSHLDRNGGTPRESIRRETRDGGDLGWFNIATPMPAVKFQFLERRSEGPLLPGINADSACNAGQPGPYLRFDHVTSNFETMAPMVLWLKHVCGLTRTWSIDFHTGDTGSDAQGSGLRSVVMSDTSTGIRFASNEPLRPHFDASQVGIYCRQQRGPGIQHIAIEVDNIISAVRKLRERGVRFVRTDPGYYQRLESHLARQGVEHIDEDPRELAELEILADGQGPGRYLLQIFMEDGMKQGTKGWGKSPFFFELIQRKGDDGFGAGNFRALFEGVERAMESTDSA